MMARDNTDDATTERLLEHLGWLRQLAGHLVRDPHDADDLAQTAALTVMQRPPAREQNIRSWLRVMIYSLWHNRARYQRRMRSREKAAARNEALPGADDVIQRGERTRDLVEAVCELDEPYQTTVMLRYFDGFPPRRIASQMQVPVATVYSRLNRGIERLRKSMDRRCGGDRSAWVIALVRLHRESCKLPLLHSLAPSKVVAVCGLLVSVGVGGLSLGLLSMAWYSFESAQISIDGSLEGEALGSVQTGASTSAERLTTQRTQLASENRLPGSDATNVLALECVRGRVLDALGRPCADVAIDVRSATLTSYPPIRSDTDGWFEVELPPAEFRVVAASDDLVTVYAGHHERGSQLVPVVVVADRASLRGRVVDTQGIAISRAEVIVERCPQFEAPFRSMLEASQPGDWRTTCDEAGDFALSCVPAAANLRLRIQATGHEPELRTISPGGEFAIRITLRELVTSDRFLCGRVIRSDGEPMPRAIVALGPRTLRRAGPHGRFRIPVGSAGAQQLIAVAPGFLPARLAPLAGPGRGRWPEFALLQLPGPALKLDGRVVDGQGRPVAGARVWVRQPELLGVLNGAALRLENVMAGAPAAASHRKMLLADSSQIDADSYFNNAKDEFHSFVTTDDAGRFRLRGLDARVYDLNVMMHGCLAQGAFGPYHAGEDDDVRLVMDTGPRHQTLAGVVVARDGSPLKGVTVSLAADVASAEYPGVGVSAMAVTRILDGPGGLRTKLTRIATGHSQVTDAAGRFRFRQVPKDCVSLALRGDSILNRMFQPGARDPADSVDNLRIKVERRCRFRIRLSGARANGIDSFAWRDVVNAPVPIYEIRGRSVRWHQRVRLRGASSPILAVPETATTLVLLRGGVECERQEVRLQLSGVSVIQL